MAKPTDLHRKYLAVVQRSELLTRKVHMLEDELVKARGQHPVLTLRDYLTAHALQGLLARTGADFGHAEFTRYDILAQSAVAYAEATMVELSNRIGLPKRDEGGRK
jgi:hypothetical protein